MGACHSPPFWGRNLTFKKSPIFQPAQKEPNLRNLAPYEKLIFLQSEKNCHLAPDVSKKVISIPTTISILDVNLMTLKGFLWSKGAGN